MNKILKSAFLLLTAGILIFFTLNSQGLQNSETTLFPDTSLQMLAVSDAYNGGESEVTSIFSSDSLLEFTYQLKSGFKYPYAGIKIFMTHSDSTGMDLSAYDSLRIKMTSNSIEAVRITLKTIAPSTRPEDPTSFCYYEKEFLPPATGSFTFAVKDLVVPFWWTAQNKPVHRKELPDLKKVNHIEITSGYSEFLNREIKIQISEIKLLKNRSPLYLLFMLFYVALGIFLSLSGYLLPNLA